jgi:hypothetical protein
LPYSLGIATMNRKRKNAAKWQKDMWVHTYTHTHIERDVCVCVCVYRCCYWFVWWQYGNLTIAYEPEVQVTFFNGWAPFLKLSVKNFWEWPEATRKRNTICKKWFSGLKFAKPFTNFLRSFLRHQCLTLRWINTFCATF